MVTPNDYLLAKCAAQAFVGKRLRDPTQTYPRTEEDAGRALAALARAMWDEACAREQRGWRWAINRIRRAWKCADYYITTTAKEREAYARFALQHCKTEDGLMFSQFCPICKPTLWERFKRWWHSL